MTEEITQEKKDELWKELKLKWSALKRGSNSNEKQKEAAKKRINEIQDELGLDKTDFTIPYEGGNRTAKPEAKGSDPTPTSAGTSIDTQKILGVILDKHRVLDEKMDAIVALLEHQPKLPLDPAKTGQLEK